MVTFRSIFVLAVVLLGFPASASVMGVARVVDGDSLRIGQTEVRLFGIDAPEAAQTCGRADGNWACGTWATETLRDLVAGRDVTCDGRETDRYGRLLAVCRVDGAEINRALVQAGAAFAYRRYSLRYVPDERTAQRAGLGLWSGQAENPEAFRRAQTAVAEARPDGGDCRIKGNISSGGRIYHRPGQENYAATGISTAKGERWFCTEAEARAAGWRAARR